jgi:hypothetical protein
MGRVDHESCHWHSPCVTVGSSTGSCLPLAVTHCRSPALVFRLQASGGLWCGVKWGAETAPRYAGIVSAVSIRVRLGSFRPSLRTRPRRPEYGLKVLRPPPGGRVIQKTGAGHGLVQSFKLRRVAAGVRSTAFIAAAPACANCRRAVKVRSGLSARALAPQLQVRRPGWKSASVL